MNSQVTYLNNGFNSSETLDTIETNHSGFKNHCNGIVTQKRSFHRPLHVIKLENVFYSYNKETILNGINMNVKRGSIYGLIGSSGCGKTTTLRMIIGLLKPSSGIVTVLGITPGHSLSTIPGPGVGYMPQEFASYIFLTIKEVLYFYARLNQMKTNSISDRINELIKLLHLPEGDRMVGTLSGGQKRRVSLAAALIHEPPLLILDEPTVGVDPILRHNIWEHLRNICMKNNQTIIITTHYHEEAKLSDCIGLMRNGRLLIEENPTKILLKMNLPSIEDVFLKLSLDEDSNLVEDNNDNSDINWINVENGNAEILNNALNETYDMTSHQISRSNSISDSIDERINKPINKITSLVWKNAINFKRNIPMFVMQFVFPVLQVLLTAACVGTNPKDITVAVYNPDESDASQLILNQFDTKSINLKYYDSLTNAIDGVKNGHAWGVIAFPLNYDELLQESSSKLSCYNDQETPDKNSTSQFPQIELIMDETNLIISNFIKTQLHLAINLAIKNASLFSEFSDTQDSFSSILSPIKISDPPIYGIANLEMTAFTVPGLILTISFFTASSMTGVTLFFERRDGILERSLSAGVKPYQFILSVILTQIWILAVQIALLMTAAFVTFDIPQNGSLLLIHGISFIQGLCGMSFGLLMSSVCKTENDALIFSVATSFPVMVLSGTFWPPQGMPKWILYISYALPQNFAGEAIRSIISRGWGLSYTIVQLGFAVSGIWVIILFLIASYFFKRGL